MFKKKKKEKWVDDGRVIADMKVDGIKNSIYKSNHHKKPDETKKKQKKSYSVRLSRVERRAIVRGVIFAFFAALIVFVVIFTIIMLFFSNVWLS